MKIKIYKKLSVVFLAFLFSCSQDKTTSETDQSNTSTELDSMSSFVSHEFIYNRINSVPSAIQLSTTIKNNEASYYGNFLSKPTNATNYKKEPLMAINIGIYGFDLAYMNTYNQPELTIKYFQAINTLSQNLKVGNFVDEDALKQMSQTNYGCCNLMQIINSSFQKMHSYLIEQKRSDISIFILYGSWIEAIYHASQLAQKNKSPLKEIIGEQKKVINNLLTLISVFKNDPNFKPILKDLEELKKLFEEVTITFIYTTPSITELDNEIEVEDNSSNEISMSDNTFKSITEKIEKIRNTITKQ